MFHRCGPQSYDGLRKILRLGFTESSAGTAKHAGLTFAFGKGVGDLV